MFSFSTCEGAYQTQLLRHFISRTRVVHLWGGGERVADDNLGIGEADGTILGRACSDNIWV